MFHVPCSCSILIRLITIGLLLTVLSFWESHYIRHWMDTSNSTVLLRKEIATTKQEVGLNEQQVAHSDDVDNHQQSTNKDSSSQKVEGAKNKPLPKPLRFCTDPVVSFGKSQILPLLYQCIGDHYDEFAHAMHTLADTLPEPMGRRDFPVATNKNILVMGNSHTRQMISSLVCQYKNEVVQYDGDVMHSNGTGSFKVNFANNSTILALTNHPIPYSPDWVALIENLFGRPLNSYDGIVLRKFNEYDESKNTNYNKMMTEALKGIPGNNDFSKAKTPTLRDVAKVFNGPVVYVSVFTLYGKSLLTANLQFIKTVNSTRQNLSTIYGRKYIDKMKMECGAMNVQSAGLCYEDSDKNVSREAHTMHRCVGAKGGHPDLIAWEVAEKLNTI